MQITIKVSAPSLSLAIVEADRLVNNMKSEFAYCGGIVTCSKNSEATKVSSSVELGV
jgi:hypothetical protein